MRNLASRFKFWKSITNVLDDFLMTKHAKVPSSSQEKKKFDMQLVSHQIHGPILDVV